MSNFELENKIRSVLWNYLDEETDGEFLRYWRLNPACLEHLIEDIIDVTRHDEETSSGVIA
jgi:hypothetical protein